MEINESNKKLAEAFGIDLKKGKISKIYLANKKSLYWDRRYKEIKILLENFLLNKLDLTESQRLFLQWYFQNNGKLAININNVENKEYVVAWNNYVNIKNSDDFVCYTYGLVGCTAIIVIAKNGYCYFSHYDGLADYMAELDKFIKENGVEKIYIIGHYVAGIANVVKKKKSNVTIFLHVKDEVDKDRWMQSRYTIKFSRYNGVYSIDYACKKVSDLFLSSLKIDMKNCKESYGFFFDRGMIISMYPINKYRPLTFVLVK